RRRDRPPQPRRAQRRARALRRDARQARPRALPRARRARRARPRRLPKDRRDRRRGALSLPRQAGVHVRAASRARRLRGRLRVGAVQDDAGRGRGPPGRQSRRAGRHCGHRRAGEYARVRERHRRASPRRLRRARVMVRGADFSAYQNDAHVEAAIAEGIGFAFVKLTQGTSYTSPAAREQLDRLRAHGVHVGVYHYLDAGASAAAQWAHFAAELAKLPYWRSLVVALDYEAPGATDAQAAAFIAAGKRDGYRVG